MIEFIGIGSLCLAGWSLAWWLFQQGDSVSRIAGTILFIATPIAVLYGSSLVG